MIYISWFLMGLGGYLIILQGYKKLTGEITRGRMLQQSPALILGPFAILFAIFIWLDLSMDTEWGKKKIKL